ncbi:hypothetical protein QYF36_009578 [Acer negundo]|nr:hypothetical protein QYF36_009578 [Acer negundo]
MTSGNGDMDQFGPWMQVSYGRNGRNIGAVPTGKNSSNQSNVGRAGTGRKHGNESPFVGAGTSGNILNGESTEESNVMTSQSYVGKRGKTPTKNVLVEISNWKPISKNQHHTAAKKYLARIPIEKSTFNKPFKENVSEMTVSNGQGCKKDTQYTTIETTLDMEEEIEDVEAAELIRDVSDEEVKARLFGIRGLKAPCLDVPSPLHMSQLRFISLCNTSYNVISKVIVHIPKNLLPEIVVPTKLRSSLVDKSKITLWLPRREGNKLADGMACMGHSMTDGMARMGHSMTNGIVFFDNPPFEIILIFEAEYRGLTCFRQASAPSLS